MRHIIYVIIKRKTQLLIAIASVLLISISSCKKLVSVDPPITSITGQTVFNSDGTSIAVLTAVYANLSGNSASFASGLNSISFLAGLSADELTLEKGVTNVNLFYYTNALSGTNVEFNGLDLWSHIYQVIYSANAAIQGLTNNNNLTPAVQQQLMGEALFVRALCYSYLVNLYGDVPMITGTEYVENSLRARTPSAQVWQQIIADLKAASGLLSVNYLDATLLSTTSEKVRPTKWASDALLSRAYLYTGDYANAKAIADSILDNTSLFSLDALNNVFLLNSNEAIWQLQPVTSSGTTNTQDAKIFVLPASGPNTGTQRVYLSQYLLNSFETGDQRRINWVDSVIANGVTYYYAYKYKTIGSGSPVNEYVMALRLGEQFLIRAEAEARGAQGGITAAITDLNSIRQRAGLPAYGGASDQTSVLNAILHERQVELFTEWGHRWFDLKRTGTINSVMGSPGNVCSGKGGNTWNSNWQLYPISIKELQLDPNLVQNNGY